MNKKVFDEFRVFETELAGRRLKVETGKLAALQTAPL
jgi:hypothetical protein